MDFLEMTKQRYSELFFEPSNTLMCNFTAFVKDASEMSPNGEKKIIIPISGHICIVVAAGGISLGCSL